MKSTIRPKRQIRQKVGRVTPCAPPNPLAKFSTGPLQLELLNRAIFRTEQALVRAAHTVRQLQEKHERQSLERQQLKLRILRTLVLGKEAA